MSYRFAIVGCGAIATRHAENIQALGQLTGVCDTDPQRLKDFSAKYNVPGFSSIPELVRSCRPDILVICTPNGTHYENALEGIDAGVDMLCEKPLTNNVTHGKELVARLTQAARKLYVVKQNRFNPPVAAVRKLLDCGRLGKILSFQINCFWNRPGAYYKDSWRGTLAQDGGTLYTQFSHFIDLLYWFLGDVREVSGWRTNIAHQGLIEFEDTGVANLVMESGAIGSISYTINSFGSNMEGSFAIFGEKGTVKIGGQYLNRLDHFSVMDEETPSLAGGSNANNYGYYEGSMSNHRKVYEELIRSLDNPSHKFLEAAEALKTVEIIDKIYKASPFVKTT